MTLANIDRQQEPDDALEAFKRQFRLRIASTDVERHEAYALRHKVFRRELDYRLGENREAPFEYDVYDNCSLLCLLHHRPSGLTAGCMRLVIPRLDALPPLDRLPLEHHCRDSLTHPTLHPARLPRERVCEVSRLAVPTHFRRKAPADQRPEHSQIFPLIGLSLFLTATALVGMVERHHAFAMMEPRLARLLGLSGLRFQRVGEVIDYHGARAAYHIDQRQAEVTMRANLHGLYRHIQASLAPQFEQAVANDTRLPGLVDV